MDRGITTSTMTGVKMWRVVEVVVGEGGVITGCGTGWGRDRSALGMTE